MAQKSKPQVLAEVSYECSEPEHINKQSAAHPAGTLIGMASFSLLLAFLLSHF